MLTQSRLRPLDLCHTRTALNVALGCLFFIGYGEAWLITG
jgi:hypothetical protein